MQKRYWTLKGNHTNFCRRLSSNRKVNPWPCQARNFATRKPPGFGSTSAKARSQQSPSAGVSHTSSKGKQASAPKSPEEAKKTSSPRRLPIGPGKLILLSLISYIGYRVYTWQTNPRRSRILDPQNFTPFILEARKKVSSTSSILNLLSLPRGQNTDNVAEAWKTGVWSVQVMQPELQIARSYTPLPPTDDAEPEQLRLFVRKEPQGEVSSFLHRIARGTLVHLRGPRIEYKIPEGVEEVLFLAGGTGIAPALQVAHILYSHRQSSSSGQTPKLRILWANRRREDSHTGQNPQSPSTQPQNPLVEEAESLKVKHPGKVSVEYLVDDEGSYITENLLRNYLGGTERDSEQSLQDRPSGRKLLLISGPEGFVNSYAGPKYMKGGREMQGPLGGLLQKIGPQGWEIWKL